MSKNVRALCARRGVEGSLLIALEAAAAAEGAPADEALRRLAEDYRLSAAAVLGTASFYDFLAPAHRGRRGSVCTGTACLLAGRQDEARERLRAMLADHEIGEMACLGRCYRGGAHQVDGCHQNLRARCTEAGGLSDHAGILADHGSVEAGFGEQQAAQLVCLVLRDSIVGMVRDRIINAD